MPISPIILQRRHAELGRIRLGAKRNGNGAPMKLEAFRFTSSSERYIRDLAALYGGEPRPWDNNGKPEWEVYTEARSIPVIAVKGGMSQWMEHWTGGGVAHRCTGERDVEGNLCDPNDPAHQAAKPTTRLSVMLPELEAVGVFRLETHGWNAAAEIPAVAELAQYVGDLVPAHLHLVERRSVKDGKTSRFVVPVLDLQIGTARLKEIVAEKSGGTAAAVESGQPQRAALEAGPQDDPYIPVFEMVEAATSLEELAGIWDTAKGRNLVGPSSQGSPRRDEFVTAWKARAHEIKAATEQQPTVQAKPDAEGVVDAEIVPDASGDADAVWQQVLKVGGELGMHLTQVVDDFEQRYAMNPSEASAGELTAYLQALQTERVPA